MGQAYFIQEIYLWDKRSKLEGHTGILPPIGEFVNYHENLCEIFLDSNSKRNTHARKSKVV
jgi:hypothetical protein